jgi:hypothetical protein
LAEARGAFTTKFKFFSAKNPNKNTFSLSEPRNSLASICDLRVARRNTPMSSDAQIAANQVNAQLSTGPRTEEGKQISSRNNFRHGLASSQLLIAGEDPAEWQAMYDGFFQDHQPANTTEIALVTSLAQHHWFAQRAVRLQTEAFTADGIDEKKLALYLRYQTTHERAFHKCLSDLLKLRAQMAKELIGFESQKQKQQLTEAKIRSLNAKSEATEMDTEIRTCIEAPLPGHERVPFEKLKSIFSAAIYEASKSA